MKKVILNVSLVLIVLIASSGYYIVNETEQAVVTRFGKPVGQAIKEAGIHYKLPLIDKINFFDKRILEWDGNKNQISTKEKRFIEVVATARWRIVDPLKYLQTVGISESSAQSRLDDVIDSAVRNEIRSNTLIEIIRNSNRVVDVLSQESEDQQDGQTGDELSKENITVGREQITRNILKKASQSVENFGIELIDVRIKGLMYENSVLQKVFDRMVSERFKIAEKIRSEGLAQKAIIEGKKNLELKKIESEAYKLAKEIEGSADAEATKIYADAFNRGSAFYEFLRSLEANEDSFKDKGEFVLGTNSQFLKILKGE